MLETLLNAIFGCPHRKITFPISPVRKSVKTRDTYVVCLDCGHEFPYDWNEMKMVDGKPASGSNGAPVFTGPKAA